LSHRVLLVEDDRELARMVSDFLSKEGFEVSIEGNGRVAAERIVSEAFDAVILDIGLPEMDGLQVCRSVRNVFDGPILVLTARGEEVDEVIALEIGADDFMSKPARPRALSARLRMHLRRSDSPSAENSVDLIVAGDLTVNPASRTVTVGGQPVSLTTAEYDLVEYLARHAGAVVPRKDLYVDLLQIPYDGLDRSIDLRVSRVRRKLGDDPNQPMRIKSIRGVGYLLAK